MNGNKCGGQAVFQRPKPKDLMSLFKILSHDIPAQYHLQTSPIPLPQIHKPDPTWDMTLKSKLLIEITAEQI